MNIMSKRALIALAAALLMVTLVPFTVSEDISADHKSGYWDGSEYGYMIYGSGSAGDPYRATITSYSSGNEADVRITSALEGHPVTEIGENAFSGNIRSVIIPSTVRTISDNSFSACSDLTDAYFMGDAPILGPNAFSQNVIFHRLEGTAGWDGSIDVIDLHVYDDGSFDYYVINGEATLHSHQGGSSVNVPEKVTTSEGTYGLTSIGPSAFQGISGVASVTLGNNVINICERAFYKCYDVVNVKFPAGLIYINDEAFRECGKFIGDGGVLRIPDSVTYMGFESFRMCHSLTSAIIPDSVTVFCDGVLRASGGLETVELGNSITSLGPWSLDNCPNLRTVRLSDDLETIGDNAFMNSGALTDITIPDSVKSIGRNAFYNCISLSSVSLGCVEEIGENAFYNCISLKSVTIPSTVTKISNKAFSTCRDLKTAVFEGPMPDMGAHVFAGTSADFKVMYRSSNAESWSGYSDYAVSVLDDSKDSNGDDFRIHVAAVVIVAMVMIVGTVFLQMRKRRQQ